MCKASGECTCHLRNPSKTIQNKTKKHSRDGQVLIQRSSRNKLFDSELVFAKCSMYEAHIRQDLG